MNTEDFNKLRLQLAGGSTEAMILMRCRFVGRREIVSLLSLISVCLPSRVVVIFLSYRPPDGTRPKFTFVKVTVHDSLAQKCVGLMACPPLPVRLVQ